jgi:methanogenic corrinoid protein MtbC1
MVDVDLASVDTGCFEAPAVRPPPREGHLRCNDDRVGSPDRWMHLARTIESGIIPRLLLTYRSDLRHTAADVQAVDFNASTPETLGRIVLKRHDDAALGFIYQLLASGLPLESIFLDLLAPTARWLGEGWAEDELSFTEVTMALSRLQRLMRTLAKAMNTAADRYRPGGRIILATAPSEQHVFGLLMLEEFFRRDGWEVECLPGSTRDDIIASMKSLPARAVGLSLSTDERLEELRVLIADLRSLPGAAHTVIMVGGRYFLDNPDMVKAVGADFTAIDGSQAISHIHSYMSEEAYISDRA